MRTYSLRVGDRLRIGDEVEFTILAVHDDHILARFLDPANPDEAAKDLVLRLAPVPACAR